MDKLTDRSWSEVDAYPYIWEELDLRAMRLQGDLIELSKTVRKIQSAVNDYHLLLD